MIIDAGKKYKKVAYCYSVPSNYYILHFNLLAEWKLMSEWSNIKKSEVKVLYLKVLKSLYVYFFKYHCLTCEN